MPHIPYGYRKNRGLLFYVPYLKYYTEKQKGGYFAFKCVLTHLLFAGARSPVNKKNHCRTSLEGITLTLSNNRDMLTI